jgi:hypothetical protein
VNGCCGVPINAVSADLVEASSIIKNQLAQFRIKRKYCLESGTVTQMLFVTVIVVFARTAILTKTNCQALSS